MCPPPDPTNDRPISFESCLVCGANVHPRYVPVCLRCQLMGKGLPVTQDDDDEDCANA